MERWNNELRQRLENDGLVERVDWRCWRIAPDAPWVDRVAAAWCMCGPGAAISHRSAARLARVERFAASEAIDISVPTKRRLEIVGVRIHESRDLSRTTPEIIHGLPCTPLTRVALDLGAVLGEDAYTSVIRDLRRDHGLSWSQLAAVLRLHSRRGRRGCGPLRRQLIRYYGVDGIPETTLEQHFLDLVIDAGLRTPVCQHVVERACGKTFRLDFAHPEVLLCFEIDGPHHARQEVVAADEARTAELEALGWRVRRFTLDDVIHRPSHVAAEVEAELRAAGLCPYGPERAGAPGIRSFDSTPSSFWRFHAT